MVGLPATGKSTFINSIIDDDTWIYSTDMYIESVAEGRIKHVCNSNDDTPPKNCDVGENTLDKFFS
jgi:predicted kinase